MKIPRTLLRCAAIGGTLILLALAAIAIGAAIVDSARETGASHHQFRWNGKGWNVDPPLPENLGTVSSPLGFVTLHALRGKSFTMDLPRCRSGYKQIRLHIWETGRSY